MTVVILVFWVTNPPGMQPIYAEKSRKGDKIVYEAIGFKKDPLISLVLFGLLPALVIGGIMGWLLTKFVL